MPGSFWNCSIRRISGSGSDKWSIPNSQRPTPKNVTRNRDWELEVGSWELCRAHRLQARNLQTAEHSRHRLSELLVHLPVRVVDGGDEQVLQHLDIVFGHDFRVDLYRLQLLGAVDDDCHHAAAGRRFDTQVGHLLLQTLLHLLRLLHHVRNVHWSISSTSRISAGNTSSTA